jgi:integrase
MATITKRKDSWFVQIRRKGFTPRYRSFRSKGEAQTWAREQETKIDAREAPKVAAQVLQSPLSNLIERYKREISPTKRSFESEQLRLSKMQRHPVCDLALREVTPSAIASYRDDRLASVKAGTVRRELSLLHHVFDTAQRQWGLSIGRNPVDDVRQPIVRDRREKRLQKGEQERLVTELAKCHNRHLLPLALFALETAMRRGELLSLQWRNVDLERRTAFLPETKNGSQRTVPLTKAAALILTAIPASDGPVFDVTIDCLKAAWRRARIRAGMPDLRFHDLRHEAVSRLFELGLSVPEVALISGHKDPRMLFRYTHLMPDQVRDRLDALGS